MLALPQRCLVTIASVIAGFCVSIAVAQENGFKLELPVSCEIGRSCFIQHLVDRDPGPGARDYKCGTLTYDGHNGVDFRLPSLASMRGGVEVLAAANGTVAAIRDGIPDQSVREGGVESVAGVECGNGVRIEHRNGWETQYCHMAEGSIRVTVGEMINAGEPIGTVGLSGETEFPHLHFVVRKAGKSVDPFGADGADNSCDGGQSLWATGVRAELSYRAPAIINTGFAAGPVTMEAIEAGILEQEQLTPESTALVAFARSIGLQAGDVEQLTIRLPGGEILVEDTGEALDRGKAQMMKFVGKRRPAGGWPRGTYSATYSIIRDGQVVEEQTFSTTL